MWPSKEASSRWGRPWNAVEEGPKRDVLGDLSDAGEPEPGKAAIDAFFTSKGNDVFAILPRWPDKKFLLRDVSGVKAVELLGSSGALKFKKAGSGVEIELPELPNALLDQPAWVLKVSR